MTWSGIPVSGSVAVHGTLLPGADDVWRSGGSGSQKLGDDLALAEDVESIRAESSWSRTLLHAERRLLEHRVVRIFVVRR